MTQPAWKRPLYLACCSILWALVGFAFQLFWTTEQANNALWTGWTWGIVGLGAVAGLAIGRLWYQIVYIEQRPWRHIWSSHRRTM